MLLELCPNGCGVVRKPQCHRYFRKERNRAWMAEWGKTGWPDCPHLGPTGSSIQRELLLEWPNVGPTISTVGRRVHRSSAYHACLWMEVYLHVKQHGGGRCSHPNVATQMWSKITQIALKLALHPHTHAKRQACVYMTHMYKAGEGTQFSQGQTPHPEPTPWVSITISYLFLFPCHSYHVAVFATAICLPFTMYCTLETVTVSGRATSFKSTSNRQNLWDWSDYPIRLHMIVDWNVLFKWMAMGTIW